MYKSTRNVLKPTDLNVVLGIPNRGPKTKNIADVGHT